MIINVGWAMPTFSIYNARKKQINNMLKNIQVKYEIFPENDLFVAICPELNVSSFGETIEEAKTSLQEALIAFLEECEEMKTLEAVLEEAGFIKENNVWLPRTPLVSELMAIA